MAYGLFTIWIIFPFADLPLAITRLNSRLLLFLFCSCLQLFCLIQKAIDCPMGDNYIKGGLLVGFFCIYPGFGEGSEETPPHSLLRKS